MNLNTRSSAPQGSTVICLFGLDGSGKTSHSLRLAEHLRSSGHQVHYSRPKFGFRLWTDKLSEPPPSSGRAPGLRNKASLGRILLAALLLAENMAATIAEVWIPLKHGKIVVAERHWPDTVVDLTAEFGVSLDSAMLLVAPQRKLARQISFYLDISAEAAYQRKSGPYPLDYMRAREIEYRRLARDINATILDTSRSFDDSHDDIMRHLEEMRDC